MRNSAARRSPRAGACPPAAHLAQAAVYYHFAKFLFVQDMDQLRAAHGAAVRCLDDALPYLDPPGERIEIGFDGAALAGILRRPRGPGPHPVVILIAGLDSAKEEFRPTEELFLRRGLATFAVDGPGQGEAEYDLAMRPDWEVPGAAIIDAVTAQPGLDPARTGIWGVSLGGYYAARLASADAGSGPASRCPGRTASARTGTGCRSSPAMRSASGRRRPPRRRRSGRPMSSRWPGGPAGSRPRC